MTLEYIQTGIPGIDKILGDKGIPKGHTILICGGPGSGKTTFAIQFLYKGITEYYEPGLYITLDEDPEDIKSEYDLFDVIGWGGRENPEDYLPSCEELGF